ncbi:hypothetical protein C7N43_09210 [Sphingobacteriales bacterium UPWRP_1]|nr:hypothetical protein B6N25_07870 [Sphingobacteriales bacterium TSM_CSS]PSJ77307.1 hypothetical protein C7N43_09210 [Sphingobacteriales bacterium UPWRP_1]
MKTQFTLQYQYNHWANRQIFEAMQQMSGNLPPDIVLLASHIIEAQEIWLQRIVPVSNPITGVWDPLPLEVLMQREAENSARWLQFIANQPPDADWYQTITYTNTQGKAFNNPLVHIMTHVVNHATYHRGQINMRLRQLGFNPIVTDFIAYARLL